MVATVSAIAVIFGPRVTGGDAFRAVFQTLGGVFMPGGGAFQ